MYYQSKSITFTELAEEILTHKHVKVQINSLPGWGQVVAERLQNHFLSRHLFHEAPLAYVKLDREDSSDSTYYFSLQDVCNTSVISHAKLTRFKEEEGL